MMLTKEQCENALGILRNVQIGESEDVEKANDIFEKLIEEHFEDKKALKERFKDYKGEPPKDDPWGDRYADECSKEEINKWILEGYGMPPVREKDDVD